MGEHTGQRKAQIIAIKIYQAYNLIRQTRFVYTRSIIDAQTKNKGYALYIK